MQNVRLVDQASGSAALADQRTRWQDRRTGPRRSEGGAAPDFFLGKQQNSNREGFPAYVADRLTAVKWRNWKMHLIKQDSMYDIPQRLALARTYNLLTDLKEERDVVAYNTWVAAPMLKIISDFEASLKTYPPIKLGTQDPYTPPQ
jgi:arylsulfatase